MCGTTGFLKAIVYFINFLVLLAGLALLVFGVATQLKIHAVAGVVKEFYEYGPITTMLVGGVILLFSCLGCCGAIRENKCMLVTYSIFILVLMILQLALSVLGYLNSDAVVQFIKQGFYKIFMTNKSAFYQIQTSLRCCGPVGAQVYFNTLPESCCPVVAHVLCGFTAAYPGCGSVVEDLVHTYKTTIGGVCAVVAALELLAVMFVVCMAKNVRIHTNCDKTTPRAVR